MHTVLHAFLVAALAAVLSLDALADIRAVTPVESTFSWSKPWWMARHTNCVALARQGGAPVVFIGDSITHYWERYGKAQWERYFADGPRRALNLGFSGDRTEHVLWRLDHGELDGFRAKVVVLMIGINNTCHLPFDQEPPCDTVIGIRAVLDRIREKQPTAKIVLCAIFPCGANANDPNRRRNETVNHEIMRFADGKTVFWCDLNERLLTADGTYPTEVSPDRVHPRDYGYEVWASEVLPFIDAALSDGRLPMPPNRYASRIGDAFYLEGPAPTHAVSLIGRREHWWKDPEMWFNALKAHRAAISEGGGAFDVVFLGDSITRHWETEEGANVLAELRKTYTILPLGIGGDRVEHNIWRAVNGELDGYRTKAVMVMVGTNNNYGDTPESVAAGIRLLLSVIRAKQPEAKIMLLPVFPRGEKPTDKMRVQNAAVNKLIKGCADGESVIWIDFTDKLVRPDGTIAKDLMPDFLHPKEEGYRIWADAIRPYLKKFCGK